MSSAPIVDYDTLQAAVVDWCKRSDLDGQAAQWIAMAEKEFNARIRTADMETRAQTTIGPDDSVPGFLQKPVDFLELRNIWIDLSGDGTDHRTQYLTYATPAMLDKMNSGGAVGMPRHFTFEGNSFRFGMVPNAPYQIVIDYLATIPALGGATVTNWLLQKYPNIYLFGALMFSAPYLKTDDRLNIWRRQLEGAPGSEGEPGLYRIINESDRKARWNAPAMERRRAIVICDGMRRRR